jgi:hypothetical protein
MRKTRHHFLVGDRLAGIGSGASLWQVTTRLNTFQPDSG